MKFPNARIEDYYRQCEALLSFGNLSWWIIDLQDNPDVFYCNPTMCRTFRLDPTLTQHSVSLTCPIAGDFNKYIAMKDSAEAQRVFAEYQALIDNTHDEYCNRFPYFDEALSKVLYFSSRARAVARDADGKATLLFGMIEPETVTEELYHLASIDCLTKLKNRREFDSQLQFMIELAKREAHYVSLILCDIDHFKLYNDTMGHYAGDQCLKQVASTLSQCCSRGIDTVCRYGGEEFAVITFGKADQTAALAEQLREKLMGLKLPHAATDLGIVTLSVGYVSVIPKHITTAKALIETADRCLYQAKARGRNQSVGCLCQDAELKDCEQLPKRPAD
ncbi:GGDEF domain-containing protein [Aliagarivorans taiwanensis]|uniref:GGDEF domain-containing protein n=1 Tax=Aliagarivorans taiwanensis TaxID=561966 RepID=UPI00040D90EF|nr:diguanylate cyclase [Aliagarivorans taiwanensis]